LSAPDGGFDTGNSADSVAPTGTDNSSAESPVSNQQADNPAWNPVLEGMPEVFANRARPHLRQWDDNYRQRESELRELREKYSPYEQYLTVDPEAIQYGLGLVGRLQQDPMAVYTALTEHVRQLGLLQNDPSANGGQQKPDAVHLEDEDPRYTELERRQKEIDDRQAAFEQQLQEQAYNKQVESYESEINAAVGKLKEQFGNAVDEHDLLQRMLVQVQRGEELSAQRAFEEQKSFFQRMYANVSQQRSAPNVLAPGGQPAANTPQKDPKDMNESERKAYFKSLLDAANAGG
jgi:hypothetical protein